MSQQYSLRWNNHQPNFISMFTTLLNTQTLVDVTLAAEGKHLQAHKVVLSACSTYFQALFVDNPSRHPIVILKDVSFADLRTMVDFMYYGEVNVTEEQLPKVLDTAKLLKIKGLTEMPDSTSLTRAQGSAAEFQSPSEQTEPQRLSTSPATSPSVKRRRRRKSSTGSTSLNMVGDDARNEDNQTVELVREGITLSSVPQRRREYDERHQDPQQTTDTHNLNLDSLSVDNNPSSMTQGGQWSMMEHTYGRYSNACIGGGGGGLQPDPGLYMNNVINPHMQGDMGEYGQALSAVVGGGGGAGAVAHPSPGPSCAAETQPPQDATPLAQPKRRRTTNPQSEENFQRALEAVRFGGIGFCKAARMFGVNNRTLWLEYKKKGYPNNRPSIKSRIKREHTTPPPEHKDEPPQPEQQMALICPPHPVSVGFIDSRPLDFPLQGMAHNSPLNILESFAAGLKLRRSKHFKRQNRVAEERDVRRQLSEPAIAPTPAPALRKYDSYPQYAAKNRRLKSQDQELGSVLIRAVTVIDRQAPITKTSTNTSLETVVSEASPSSHAPRASHTPAVRSGPPLSCNFCWNTVDECGRILRRKTQYHCPECRTNLCIVPCFHEYHEADPEASASANVR